VERRSINPWTWQEAFGFEQAVEVTGAQRVLLISGQTSINADGAAEAAGDMVGQVTAAIDNLETVLKQAGMSSADVVRLTVYTTDMDRFLGEGHEILATRLAGVEHAMTLIGVTRLAFPELLVEIEATALSG
jgi:enamine deaminase RidA (YjgF/YER057c/UK114 family)